VRVDCVSHLFISHPVSCRVQTSYVSVEPKRRKQAPPSPHPTQPQQPGTAPPADTSIAQSPAAPAGVPAVSGVAASTPPPHPHLSGGVAEQRPRRGSSGRELRRARIVITVQRTENYKRWLQENPLQAIIAGDGAAEDFTDDKETADSADD
jgi:hypothetical protein